jgi:hypothetical protein
MRRRADADEGFPVAFVAAVVALAQIGIRSQRHFHNRPQSASVSSMRGGLRAWVGQRQTGFQTLSVSAANWGAFVCAHFLEHGRHQLGGDVATRVTFP